MKWISINHYLPTLEVDKNDLFSLSRPVTVQLVSGETCTAQWGGKIHGWVGLLSGCSDCHVIAWTDEVFENQTPYEKWYKENQKRKELEQGIYDTSVFDNLSNFCKMTQDELAVMAGSFVFVNNNLLYHI